MEPLKIIDKGDTGYIEYVPENWKKVDYVDDHSVFINIGNIEKSDYFRHVYGMIKFSGEPHRIAGVGTGISIIISEATMDCKAKLIIPIRDFYLTDEFRIIKFITYQIGKGLVKANEKGTIAESIYQTACDPV